MTRRPVQRPATSPTSPGCTSSTVAADRRSHTRASRPLASTISPERARSERGERTHLSGPVGAGPARPRARSPAPAAAASSGPAASCTLPNGRPTAPRPRAARRHRRRRGAARRTRPAGSTSSPSSVTGTPCHSRAAAGAKTSRPSKVAALRRRPATKETDGSPRRAVRRRGRRPPRGAGRCRARRSVGPVAVVDPVTDTATARLARPHTGVDHGEHDTGPEVRHGAHQRQRARPDVERRHAVGQVDDRNAGRVTAPQRLAPRRRTRRRARSRSARKTDPAARSAT